MYFPIRLLFPVYSTCLIVEYKITGVVIKCKTNDEKFFKNSDISLTLNLPFMMWLADVQLVALQYEIKLAASVLISIR